MPSCTQDLLSVMAPHLWGNKDAKEDLLHRNGPEPGYLDFSFYQKQFPGLVFPACLRVTNGRLYVRQAYKKLTKLMETRGGVVTGTPGMGAKSQLLLDT